MKKALKVFFITIASLLVILIIAISIALWVFFTPEKLLPIVRDQAGKYLTCHTEVGNVELTFLSTFPNFGLKVDHVVLINPTPGALSDTLVNIEQLIGIVDLAAWWKRDELKINELNLRNGSIYIFCDSLGNTNYAIFTPDTITAITPDTET